MGIHPKFGAKVQRLGSQEACNCSNINQQVLAQKKSGPIMVAHLVKNLPVMQEIWVQSLGQEDPLEKRMATQSSILAWRIPWTEEHGGLQSLRLQRIRHN